MLIISTNKTVFTLPFSIPKLQKQVNVVFSDGHCSEDSALDQFQVVSDINLVFILLLELLYDFTDFIFITEVIVKILLFKKAEERTFLVFCILCRKFL